MEKVKSMAQNVNEFLDECFDLMVSRHPEMASSLGLKMGYDSWDDRSDTAAAEDLKIMQSNLQRLKQKFKPNELDDAATFSVQMYAGEVKRMEEDLKWIRYGYEVTQMGGVHNNLPAFLINVHRIDSVADADCYLKRLQKLAGVFDQTVLNLKASETIGVFPPHFTFDYVRHDLETFISSFDRTDDTNVLYADFSAKTDKLEIGKAQKDALKEQAINILKSSVKNAYQALLDYWIRLEPKARTNGDKGAWNLPHGDEYYRYMLRWHRTADNTPDEVYETGLEEVARIQKEMCRILQQINFSGSLQDFFQLIRTDKKFKYTQDDAGKANVLADANRYIDNMRAKLPEWFRTLPKAELVVKQVESFREKSAGGAFYEDPAVDGSRPGRYYVNTYDMDYEPKYQMEALTYHEAIPGHHMQIAIAQELKEIPKFRRHGFYTAYIEGWALYAEKLGKEMGGYEDPYSNFGRLSMEIFRAARLVVDVGIHYKQWNRQQAIDYFVQNTANAEGDIRSEIERYFIWPGQATAYKTGMMKILELRVKAQQALAGKFDICEFHDVVLTHGALPLNVLEQLVMDWITSKE